MEENEAAGRGEAREMSLLMDEQNDKSFHQTATDPDTTTSPSCSACSRQGIMRGVKDNLVMILTLLGVILGFLVGFGVSRTRPSDTVIMWLGTWHNNFHPLEVVARKPQLKIRITEIKTWPIIPTLLFNHDNRAEPINVDQCNML